MVVMVSQRYSRERGGDIQDIEGELSRVKCKFESDRFTDTLVYATHFVQ